MSEEDAPATVDAPPPKPTPIQESAQLFDNTTATSPPTNNSTSDQQSPPPSSSPPPPSDPSPPPPASPTSPPPAPPPSSPPPSPPPASPPPPNSPPPSPPPSSPPPSSPPPSPPPETPPPPSPPPETPPPPSPTPETTPPPSPPPPTALPPPPSITFSPPPPLLAPPTVDVPPVTPVVFSPSPPTLIDLQTPPSLPPDMPPPLASGNTSDQDLSFGPPPSSSSSSSDSSMNGVIIAGIAVGAVLIVVLCVVIACLLCTRRRKRPQYYMNPAGRPPNVGDQYYNDHRNIHLAHPPPYMGPPVGSWGAAAMPLQSNASSDFSSGYSGQHHVVPSPNMGGMTHFKYEDLAAATSGFSQANVLGQGGFGFVHKGILQDRREVAVKSLKSGSGQGEREFQAEVEIISRVHHRHLVSLVGYCIASQQRMLVYEFVPNKTLEFHLHGKDQPVMEWPTRLRIAIGSAKGLAYLHEDCQPRIIHRDIKAANILLDYNFEAMVADFGLAKLTSDNFTHVSTRVMGTFGYLAPEYASSGKLTEKSDVFSFGVMLLELITGRRPVDTSNIFMEDSLVDWARPRLTKAMEDGKYEELIDPRLQGNYDPHEMGRMVVCAAASIRHSARKRPKMSQIIRALEGDSSLEDLNEGVKPGQSTIYNPNGETSVYDTRAYNADMLKFKNMVMSSQEFNSSEYGGTSEVGLHPSSSSDSLHKDGEDKPQMSEP